MDPQAALHELLVSIAEYNLIVENCGQHDKELREHIQTILSNLKDWVDNDGWIPQVFLQKNNRSDGIFQVRPKIG